MKSKLLLVDDSQIVLNIIDKTLEGISENDKAANGAEAISRISQENYDGVFLDISMPDFDGFQVLEVLNQSGIDIPVTVLTGSDDEKTIRKVCEYGADYIEKPVKPEIIREKALSMISRSNQKNNIGNNIGYIVPEYDEEARSFKRSA